MVIEKRLYDVCRPAAPSVPEFAVFITPTGILATTAGVEILHSSVTKEEADRIYQQMKDQYDPTECKETPR